MSILNRLRNKIHWWLLKLLGLDALADSIRVQKAEVEKLVQLTHKNAQEARHYLNQTEALMKRIREVTAIDVDIALVKGRPNTIILSGQFRNQAYVNVYDVTPETFADLIYHLKDLQKIGQLRHIDAPPSFRAMFERDH